MQVPARIENAAKRRIAEAQASIQHATEQIENGTPLHAEPEQERAVRRVAAVTQVSPAVAARIVNDESPAALGLSGASLRKAEALQGRTVDYVGAAWLEAGRIASNAVARLVFRNGQPQGTGFLISDRLLLTNNHVIPDRHMARDLVVEFAYEIRLGQTTPAPIRFELAPEVFFETDEEDDLDFTLIAVGAALTTGATVSGFGACPLSGSSAKHSVGEPVNIVQHPDGDFKQVVVRENRILHRGDTVLHYVADTEPGASGSPVFNDEWHVVALHHWGGPHREVSAGGRPLRRDVNEGIRISAIVAEVQQRMPGMTANQRQLLEVGLRTPLPGEFGTRRVHITPHEGAQQLLPEPPRSRFALFPTISESAERGGAPASRIDRHYGNRRGYNERFLPNFPVPLPQLNDTQRRVAARVRGVGESSGPFELKYQHFSVVLNAQRRMPFFSICNIDGAKHIRVNRDTGVAVSGPEATEVWATDPRVPDEAQLDDGFYSRMRRDLRTPADFFARGHMTRREDPNWGFAEIAERANDDTFHHPNACPQVQNAFNGSQKVWQGIENYVLNAADDTNLRVTVITGPVFDASDPIYEDEEFGRVSLPQRFWKVVARIEDGHPIVFAVLADQSEAMDVLIRARREGPEATWEWPRRLSREYISSVAEVTTLSGLDFGDLGQFDIFADGDGEGVGGQRREVTSPEMLLPHAHRDGPGFGRFESLGDFLSGWESALRSSALPAASSRASVPATRDGGRGAAPRARRVVEIEARVKRVYGDDLNGAKHQHFSIVPLAEKTDDEKTRKEVRACIERQRDVRVAVRFGDSRGVAARVPGIRGGARVYLKGEWIPASEVRALGGEDTPVMHFVHDPLGWLCTTDACYS